MRENDKKAEFSMNKLEKESMRCEGDEGTIITVLMMMSLQYTIVQNFFLPIS